MFNTLLAQAATDRTTSGSHLLVWDCDDGDGGAERVWVDFLWG
jgi:hypothetical protein